MNYYDSMNGYRNWNTWTSQLVQQVKSNKHVSITNRVTGFTEDSHLNNGVILESELVNVDDLVSQQDTDPADEG